MTRAEAGRLGAAAARSTHVTGRIERIRQWDADPKHCYHCKIALPYDKRRDKFCSNKCARLTNNPLRKRRSDCVQCGGTLSARKHKFCSRDCAALQRSRSVLREWLDGRHGGCNSAEQLSIAVRRYMLEKANHACQRCGWSEVHPLTGKSPLQVDHIDGNALNNVEDNLRVLCPNCHSLTATFGARNVGKGRASRRARYRKATNLASVA